MVLGGEWAPKNVRCVPRSPLACGIWHLFRGLHKSDTVNTSPPTLDHLLGAVVGDNTHVSAGHLSALQHRYFLFVCPLTGVTLIPSTVRMFYIMGTCDTVQM